MSETQLPKANIAYSRYFGVLDTMSRILRGCISRVSRGKNAQMFEQAFTVLIQRLQFTSRALHLKYAFSHASLSGEAMRIKSSGFPHSVEIQDMLIDLVQRGESTKFLDTVEELKASWLKRALETGEDDAELLWRIGERRYLDLLDPENMLLQVVTGAFEDRGSNDDAGFSAFWWICYDPKTHSPCVHVLEYVEDKKKDVDLIFENGPEQATFLQVIRDRGNRAPSVSVLAHDLDLALPHVHPKRLTRIHADMLFSTAIEKPESEENSLSREGARLLREYANGDDFMLRFIRDVVESKGETKGSFLNRKNVTQIFDLESTKDGKAIERGATTTDEFLILPHSVAQHCASEKECSFAPYNDATRKLVYSNGGHVDAV